MFLQRVLYVANEVVPFLGSNALAANCVRKLLEAMQNKQIDVRVMVPKFGTINDRMHRLHEVIRLSTSTAVIDGIDYSITVKVGTIPNTRLQVYFIGNDCLFGNKNIYATDDFMDDNELRMIFFAISVIKTIKKLEWEADIVHCHDWMTSLIPLLWKKLHPAHPLFSKAKLITTIYNNEFTHCFPRLREKLITLGILEEEIACLTTGKWGNILQLMLHHTDLIFRGEDFYSIELEEVVKKRTLPLIQNDIQYSENFFSIYKKLITPLP